jgi:hypothetical protein
LRSSPGEQNRRKRGILIIDATMEKRRIEMGRDFHPFQTIQKIRTKDIGFKLGRKIIP